MNIKAKTTENEAYASVDHNISLILDHFLVFRANSIYNTEGEYILYGTPQDLQKAIKELVHDT